VARSLKSLFLIVLIVLHCELDWLCLYMEPWSYDGSAEWSACCVMNMVSLNNMAIHSTNVLNSAHA